MNIRGLMGSRLLIHFKHPPSVSHTHSYEQLVIFLYLLDNDTSWMVLLSSGLSLVVDVWKVHKGLVASVRPHVVYTMHAERPCDGKKMDEIMCTEAARLKEEGA